MIASSNMAPAAISLARKGEMSARDIFFGAIVAIAGLLPQITVAAAGPEDIVQAQLEAYNARDLNAFLATYAPDAQLFEHPSKPLARGLDQLRERYSARFAEPNLHAQVMKRIVMGSIVVDHELVTRTFSEGTGTLEAIAIYEVQESLITRVWFVFGAPALDPKPQ
jgi:putative hydrolase of HD superfamily